MYRPTVSANAQSYAASLASGRGKGCIFPPLDFVNILLNVLILFLNNKWLWNYQNDLKSLKHIKVLTLLVVLFLFSAPLLVPVA